MSKDWNYKSGDWWVLCDSCNKKIKGSHARHRWDGFIVCDKCFEHRHPQDYIKAKTDKIIVPFTRPRTVDVFTSVSYVTGILTCTPMSKSGVAGIGIAGCMKAGQELNGVL